MYDYNEITELIKKELKPDDTFEFQCNQCGKCCKNREDILLTPYDIYRASRYLNLETKDFFDKYCETFLGHTSKLPVVRLRPKYHEKACPLLSSNGACKVHSAKPVVCALFPLGRVAPNANDKIHYLLQEIRCGSKGKRYTVKEWLAGYNIPESEKSMHLWTDIIVYMSLLIDKKLKNLSERVMTLVYNAFFNALYISYNIHDEFMPQFEKRVCEFKKIMQKTSKMI